MRAWLTCGDAVLEVCRILAYPDRMTLAAIVCGIFMYRVERPRAVQLAGLQRLNSDRDKVLALFRDLRN